MDNMRFEDLSANENRTFSWTHDGKTTEITTDGLTAQLKVTAVANPVEPTGGSMHPSPLEGVGIATCLVIAAMALCVIVDTICKIYQINKKLDALLTKKGKP